MREQDKHFLATLYLVMAIIFIWKGVWEGWYEIPYLGSPFVALFIGLTILTLSGLIFKEFDPFGSVQQSTISLLNKLHQHPKKEHFQIKYYDANQKKDIVFVVQSLRQIEENVLIFGLKGKEHFIPIHRVKEILFKGARYWRL